jgi:hypothetical protein
VSASTPLMSGCRAARSRRRRPPAGSSCTRMAASTPRLRTCSAARGRLPRWRRARATAHTRADQPPARGRCDYQDRGREGQPPPGRVAEPAPDLALQRRLDPPGSCVLSVSSPLRGWRRSLPYRRRLGYSCMSGQRRAQRCFNTRRAGAGRAWRGARSGTRCIGRGCGDGAPGGRVPRDGATPSARLAADLRQHKAAPLRLWCVLQRAGPSSVAPRRRQGMTATAAHVLSIGVTP